MDMVPLILLPLPAGTMLNSISRRRERDIAENHSFSASWCLGVGSAGSCRNAAASTSSSSAHTASSVPRNFSTHSLFSIRHLSLHAGPNIQWPAGFAWTSTDSFAAKCLRWDASPWNFCHWRVHSGKSQREHLQKVLLVQQQPRDRSGMQWGKTMLSPSRSDSQPGRWAIPWVLNLTLKLWPLLISAMPKFSGVLFIPNQWIG